MATTPSADFQQYRQYVRRRLDALNRVFADASVGDFSTHLDIPDQDDEFTALYAGIGIMLDVIREKIGDAERLNAELTDQVKRLERMNRLMVGREIKMKELKKKLTDLRAQLNQPPAQQP